MARSADVVTAGLQKVPPFPPVAAKLLQLLTNAEVDLGEVAELASSDATFSAVLLQRANSAEFGLASPITSMRHAVALLGIELTRRLVVMRAAAAYVEGALKTEELRRCWEHTVATAVLADEVAQACEAFTQTAFTAGIMHDVGRLGLLVAYPADYERVVRDSAARCIDLLDFEQEEFGLDHAAAGRILAARWGLPEDLAVVAGRHHDPSDGSELGLLEIIHVACRLADFLGYDVVHPLQPPALEDVLSDLPLAARKRLNIDPAALRERVDQQMSRYSSTQNAPPPEESLALLAPVIAAQAEPSSSAAAEPSEREAPQPAAKRDYWVVALLILGAVALAALLLWELR